MMTKDEVDRVKFAIAEKFSPAIDFNAPYAKAMLEAAARNAIEAYGVALHLAGLEIVRRAESAAIVPPADGPMRK